MNRPRLMVTLLALLVVSIWLWPPPVLLAQVRSVAIEGQVANGTEGGGSVAGLTVVLHQESSTIHNDLETVTDEEGRFRFDGIEYRTEQSGCAILEGAVAWLDCRVSEVHEAGDHSVVIGEVIACDATDGEPLIFFRGSYYGVQI